MTPGKAYERTLGIGRDSNLEKIILTSAEYSFLYSRFVIKGRWPEAEEIIKTSPYWSYRYALDVVKGQWPEAEEIILASAEWSYRYIKWVTTGRRPEVEETIAPQQDETNLSWEELAKLLSKKLAEDKSVHSLHFEDGKIKASIIKIIEVTI